MLAVTHVTILDFHLGSVWIQCTKVSGLPEERTKYSKKPSRQRSGQNTSKNWHIVCSPSSLPWIYVNMIRLSITLIHSLLSGSCRLTLYLFFFGTARRATTSHGQRFSTSARRFCYISISLRIRRSSLVDPGGARHRGLNSHMVYPCSQSTPKR